MKLLNRCKDNRTPHDIKEFPITFGRHGLKIKGSILLPARALENEVYVVACGQTGEEYYGHSKIIDYAGNILTECEEEEGLRVAELDLARQEKWRRIVTYFDDRRPNLYSR